MPQYDEEDFGLGVEEHVTTNDLNLVNLKLIGDDYIDDIKEYGDEKLIGVGPVVFRKVPFMNKKCISATKLSS